MGATDKAGDSALRRADFEKYLGDHVWQFYEGHPCMCPIKQPHAEHEFHYAYLDGDGGRVDGCYLCRGDANNAPPKPENGS